MSSLLCSFYLHVLHNFTRQDRMGNHGIEFSSSLQGHGQVYMYVVILNNTVEPLLSGQRGCSLNRVRQKLA